MEWGMLAAMILLLGALPVWIIASLLWSIVTFFYACYEMLSPMISGGTAGWGDYAMAPIYAFVQGVVGAIAVPVWIWEWASLNPLWAAPLGLICGYILARKL